MSAREAQLTDANAITVDWVWLLPAGRSSLAQWLSTEAGIFWIQGKPGSGKSTLMNYLKGHSRTKLYLAQASEHHPVLFRLQGPQRRLE
jgi:putative ribosome biogenesis GTPase RsgA